MENDATKYPVTEDLNALKSAFSGTISSQAAEQSVEGSTTTKSNPENLGRNSHEWANKGTLVGITREVLQSLYLEFRTLDGVASFVGVSKKLVLNKMNFFEIPRSKRNRLEQATERIVLLAKEGLSIPEISRAVGLSVTAVRQVTDAAGIMVSDPYHPGYIITHNRYKMLHCPEHPKCDSKGYVREHILVVERLLGRYLQDGEIVHHQNEDTSDNRLENLVVTTRAEHIRLHNPRAARWAKRDLCKI